MNISYIYILGLAGFVSAADNWFVSPALPAIAEGLGVTAAAAVGILTAYLIPYGILQPVYGFWGDRIGKVRLLQILTAGLAAGAAGCAVSQSLEMLMVFRFLTGWFAAGVIAVSLGIIGDREPAERRQHGVGLFMGLVFLGQGTSAGLGGVLAEYTGWQGAFLLFAFLSLLACGACLWIRKEETSEKRAASAGFYTVLKEMLHHGLGRKLFLLALYAGICLIGAYSFFGAYLHDRFGLNYMECGLAVMAYGLACLFGGRWVGWLCRYLGRPLVLKSGAALAAAGLLFLWQAAAWELAVIGIALFGFAYIFIQSSLAALAFSVSETYRGMASGLVGTGLFCGGGIGSAVGSVLWNRGGYEPLWTVFLAGAAILYVLIYSFVKSECEGR